MVDGEGIGLSYEILVELLGETRTLAIVKPHEIKAFREKHNLTQAQLAELLPVKLSTLQAWEAGRFDPPTYLFRAFTDMKNLFKK